MYKVAEGQMWEGQASTYFSQDKIKSPGTKEVMGQVCFKASSNLYEGVDTQDKESRPLTGLLAAAAGYLGQYRVKQLPIA